MTTDAVKLAREIIGDGTASYVDQPAALTLARAVLAQEEEIEKLRKERDLGDRMIAEAAPAFFKLREALREALDNWEGWEEDQRYTGMLTTTFDRIAELRRLVDP